MRSANVLRFSGLAFVLFVQTVSANTIRILPFGDSDTSGAGIYISYRYDLWLQLQDAGFDVDFVGGKRTVVFDPNLYPRVDEFDRDYEGQGSMRLPQMIEVAQSLVQENDPDVVLVKSSSDLCNSPADAAGLISGQLPQLINLMRAENPNLHFILGTSSEWVYNTCDQNVRDHFPAFNQAIIDVAALQDTPQSRVLVSDHYNGFNFDTMFDLTNQHNNRQGEMFVAGRWFEVLESFLPTIQGTPNNFTINAGLNDAWFNPATLGQGFFVTVFPDIEMMFLAWFTYDTERPAGNVMANLGEPGHRWLTAFGPYMGNTATLDIELTSGGIFNSGTPSTSSVPDGSIMVEFDGCNSGTVSYDILSAGVAGEIPIERIALDNVPVCEALSQ